MKNERMEKLNNANVDTSKFFNVNVNVPVGADLQILIDGVPYKVTSDMIANGIMDAGYVFNRKTDGRYITAQTFHMLNDRSFNWDKKEYEKGWDAYLRNRFVYDYQFTMLADELHRLARMEKEKDPAFEVHKKFFTKDVVVALCDEHIFRAKKFINKIPVKHYQGKPYKRIPGYGDVLFADIQTKVYGKLLGVRSEVFFAKNYKELEKEFNNFRRYLVNLPYNTPKCKEWKDAFKGKGGYITLMNIIKWHGCRINLMDTRECVAYVERCLEGYKGNLWRFHYLLKEVIAENNFDLATSIEKQKRNK